MEKPGGKKQFSAAMLQSVRPDPTNDGFGACRFSGDPAT